MAESSRIPLTKPAAVPEPGLRLRLHQGLSNCVSCCTYGTSSPAAKRPALKKDNASTEQEQQSELDETPPRSTTSSNSAVLATVNECRQKYPNCVLLVRVGDFYELYYEQADEVGGDVLGLQVVDKKFRNGSVRFTGFPSRSLLRYIELLVYRHGLSIALCEQFQEPMRRTFTRKVTRVITPGTLIDDQCIADTRVHNYILSIARLDQRQIQYKQRLDEWQRAKAMVLDAHEANVARVIANARREWIELGNSESEFNESDVTLPDAPEIPLMPQISEIPDTENQLLGGKSDESADVELSLAWLDLATGDFMTCPSSRFVLATDIARIRPKEILVDSSSTVPPKRYKAESHVRMSAPTIQALELLRPLMGDHAEAGRSLLSEIDHTRTSAGGRLLTNRLVAPSADLDIIERRLDLVEFFGANPREREHIHEQLSSIGDVERAVNKLSLNCGGPHDLLDIARTLQVVSKIKAILGNYLERAEELASANQKQSSSSSSSTTRRRRRSGVLKSYSTESEIRKVVHAKESVLQSLDELSKDILLKIKSDAPRDLKEFGFLQPNCSKEIKNLYALLDEKDDERRQLQERWKQQYGCTTLKLDTIPALGHFIEVSKRESARMSDVGSDFRMIQSLKSKVRFENNEWTYLLSEIEMLRNRLQAEEMRIFEELRNSALAASLAIRTNSKILAEIDVAISSALHALTRQYVRPRFVSSYGTDPKGKQHTIMNGRHPVVESQLLESSRQYVGNDCMFHNANARVLLLTGPNMGGKSTYLRQIALTSILAQIGAFVPADDAQLQIVDAIYSRIGAHDNLALDQSTFMIEMSETADILKHATPDSLVILDEIGRGTSTSDGIAIAYATLRYLHDKVRCKAVFATHYHELVPHVVPKLDALSPLHTAVYEDGKGGFSFLHKVRPGICTNSHALYVAQIAGIPKRVLEMARDFAVSKA
ncbi:MutS protein 1 [Coemansia sp. RSA 1285]|nr:MutS protein 1 [Coemansia sp. RSA 1285]